MTGASSGIGRGVALALAGKGVRVIAAARRIDALDSLASESGGRITALKLDVTDVGTRLAAHWRNRPLLLDCSHILDEHGRERMPVWLGRMISDARAKRAMLIPSARLSDPSEAELHAFKSFVDSSVGAAFALLLASGDLADIAVVPRIRHCLDRLGTTAGECVLVIDFSDADLSLPEFAEPVIRYGVELVQELGSWRKIVFQGTGFPEKNPAEDGGCQTVRRSEWAAWKHVVATDPTMLAHLTFGDYAADCAKMTTGKGGVAIRHLRYTCDEDWLVQRGRKLGRSDKTIMSAVCQAIVGSGHFSGASFSAADAQIWALANGVGGAGTATTWRQLNTTHHITTVVSNLVEMRGGVIKSGPAPAAQLQLAV
ncbi:beta family protein [Sphingomonas sp.]|uniref:beta family protein n=1 Tax=Sphingomonas sp. TaxID=28214 RepID=UPI003CC56D85